MVGMIRDMKHLRLNGIEVGEARVQAFVQLIVERVDGKRLLWCSMRSSNNRGRSQTKTRLNNWSNKRSSANLQVKQVCVRWMRLWKQKVFKTHGNDGF